MKASISVFVIFLMLLSGCSDKEADVAGSMFVQEPKSQKVKRLNLTQMSLEETFPDEETRALARAAESGDLTAITKLIKSGVDVNAKGSLNATPLLWAVGNNEGFTRLLELGADPNVVFEDGNAVMHLVIDRGDADLLKTALKYKGSPNLVAGKWGRTPLFLTIGQDKTLASILLKSGADMNAVSAKGNTPMLVAAGRGKFDFVYDFLILGADFTVRNNNGKDLADRTVAKRRLMDPNHELGIALQKVIDFLRGKGVEIDE